MSVIPQKLVAFALAVGLFALILWGFGIVPARGAEPKLSPEAVKI